MAEPKTFADAMTANRDKFYGGLAKSVTGFFGGGAKSTPAIPHPLKPQDSYEQFKSQQKLFTPPKPPTGPLPSMKPPAAPLGQQPTKLPQTGTMPVSAPTPSPSLTVSGATSGAVTTPLTNANPTAPAPPASIPTTDGAAPPTANTSNTAPPNTPAENTPSAPVDMAQPVDNDFVTKQISDESLPIEQRQQIAQTFVQDHVKQNPLLMQGLQDIQAGKTDTEAARAFMSKLDEQKAAFIQAHPQEAATPQGFGQLMQQWEAMPFANKAMMGVGLPLGLIGIMSSLFGKGGMGMGIMGLLGLGAAGLGGATGGMFGEGAQNAVNDAAFNMGQFMGMVPEQADLSILNNEDPAQALIQGDGKANDGWFGPKVETVQRQLTEGKEKAEQLRKLLNAPMPESMKIHFMRRLDPSIGDGRDAFARAQQLIQQYDDPQSALGRHIRTGEKYVQAPWATGFQIATGQDPLAAATPGRGRVQARHGGQTKGSAYKFAFNDVDAKELADLKLEQAKKYDVENARRLHELEKRKQVSAPAPKAKKTIVMVACQKAAQEKYMNLERVFKKWAAEKAAFDPSLLAAGAGAGLGLGGLGLMYMFGNGPNSRKGRQQRLAQTQAAREHFATAKDGTKIYRQNWRWEPSKDGLSEYEVADFVDEHGNKISDPFALGTQIHAGFDDDTGQFARSPKTAASALITKAARCWAGYEPVPGAKAYSRGSCRPKGSKKTQKEMKKQSTEGTSYGQTSRRIEGSKPG